MSGAGSAHLSTISRSDVDPRSLSLPLDPCLSTVPLWNLTSSLKSLSLTRSGPIDSYDFTSWSEDESFDEQSEESFISFELPAEPPITREDKRKQLDSVACRTVIAAVKTGHLRRLTLSWMTSDEPFRMRTLLPFWVGMEDWSIYRLTKGPGAAVSLRAALAHASLWLNTTPSLGAREERRLTRQEVQGLQAYFKQAGTLELVCNISTVSKPQPQPLEHYLPWLAEDGELAQQVADAWKVVVQRGEADVITCRCKNCRVASKGGT